MFQFTRPHWGATRNAMPNYPDLHSFNSRARTGARLESCAHSTVAVEFQFTRPHWGATNKVSVVESPL